MAVMSVRMSVPPSVCASYFSNFSKKKKVSRLIRPRCYSEISETLGLDIQVLVSSGLCLENCLYTSLGLGLDHQEFPSLNLGLEINQQLSSANGTEFQKLLHN